MKCLVAGGAGFIGSHLCESLLRDGYDVLCVDSLITGDKDNINSLFSNSKFTFVEQDITKSSNFKFQSSKFDYIFHLASPASPNKKSPHSYINHPIETLLANSLGTYALLQIAQEANAAFLYASSSETYGNPAISPQDETYFGNVNPVGTRSVYDEGKRFGEAMTMAFVRKFNLDGRIVRIFNTYGPKMQSDDGRVVSNLITQAIANKPITIYGDGKQTRSLCYISDMIGGIKKAMFSKKSRGEVINLGNPDERSIVEFAELIKKLTQSTSSLDFSELPQDDPARRKPDITKAKRLLSWQPKVGIEEGLLNTIQYFKAQGSESLRFGENI